MINGKINIDHSVGLVEFNLRTSLADVFNSIETSTLFNEMNKTETKMSTCLALMASMFALIEKREIVDSN